MQKLLYVCLLLGLHGTLYAPLFFWEDRENNIFGLHYDLYDVCIDGGVCTGYNHTDVPLFITYIREVLLPRQNASITSVLKQLLVLLNQYSVAIPYQRDFYGAVNQIKPISSTAAAPAPPAQKPLSTEEKKEQVLQMLVALGLAKPFNMPKP